MPFWRLNYHLVWSTKNRESLIQPNIEQRLYGYLINKAAELGVYVYAINGWLERDADFDEGPDTYHFCQRPRHLSNTAWT